MDVAALLALVAGEPDAYEAEGLRGGAGAPRQAPPALDRQTSFVDGEQHNSFWPGTFGGEL